MNNKAVLIQEQKQALLDLWAALELGEAPHPRQFAVWLLDYDYAAIESALKITATWINKQEEDATPRARSYVDGVLRGAVIQKMTPEQREEKLSQMRSLKATIAAKARWQKERREIIRELASEHTQASSSIPEHAQAGVLVGVGVRGKEVKSKSKVSDDSLKSFEPSNRVTRKPKTCKQCGGPLSRDKNHTCENTGGTSRPPSPTASPSSADNIPAAPEAPESAAPPSDYYTRYQTCPFCWAAKIPFDLYQKHLAQCKAKHEQAAQAAAQGVSIQ